MAKLTFWIAEQHDDADCYNLVARTRKALLVMVSKHPSVRYDAPKKVVVEYKDAFDLFDYLTCESGGRHSHL
jgi:hypothetical protein